MAKAKALRTASPQFQAVWDELDERRERAGQSVDLMAKKCGFKRATWFVYQRTGTIAFNKLELLAANLGTQVQLLLPPGKLAEPESSGTNAPALGRGSVIDDYARMFAGMLEGAAEEELPFLAGAMLHAAKRARDEAGSFSERAGEARPPRARK